MWNTGCNVVYNRTALRLIYIVNGENQNRTLLIPPGNEFPFAGDKFPWANSPEEVTTEAFRVQ